MATIRARAARDGSKRYTAQIRVTIGGVKHTESKTFGNLKAAQVWARKREAELEEKGLPRAASAMSVAEACGEFLAYLEGTPAGVGRSRAQTIRAMSRHPVLQAQRLEEAGAQAWLDYFKARREGVPLPDGRVIGACAGSRLTDDATYLRTVLRHAASVWRMHVNLADFETAVSMAWDNGTLMEAQSRELRFPLDELDRILSYWVRPRSGKGAHMDTSIPMLLLVPFLIFSTRREDEMCRIRWDDLDRERSRVLVRDMKHPRKKRGNDVWVHLPARAMSIIDKMPAVDARIFPYDPRTVGNQFRKARTWAGVNPKLRLHDLRHEGISHYFELGYDIPRVSQISGHRSWGMLGRYTHLMDMAHFDKFAGWPWLERLGIEPLRVRPARLVESE